MAELALLGAIWGGSFLLMRVAASEFGPLALVEIRLAFGALVLLPFIYGARKRLAGRWHVLIAIGMINSAVPFTLFAWSTLIAPAAAGRHQAGLTANPVSSWTELPGNNRCRGTCIARSWH